MRRRGPPGVGGAEPRSPCNFDLASTLNFLAFMFFSIFLWMNAIVSTLGIMRPLRTEKLGRTVGPNFNHITAYFIVHPTHAASLPDSLVHTNWLFTRQEKLAHTRALNLTFRKKERIHNRSVVIHRRSYPDRKQLAQ